jgi:hypothetical protein
MSTKKKRLQFQNHAVYTRVPKQEIKYIKKA